MRAAAVAVLLLLLPGCASVGSDAARVLREGLDDATFQDAETVACGDQVELALDLVVDEGLLRVRVLDGAGRTAFDEPFGPDARNQDVRDAGRTVRGIFGEAGTWSLQVEGDGLTGRVEAVLSCQTR